ncbi:conserved hypothetical protein [Leishmania mexicana MHOM/GT/2001/U1103]|uniref:Uncharacterized protein n=1 Tax=Leishmania mexicana (strain MHOM/GT/2001/U1103) TaxID=929439 RepID=E9B2Z1_LEIMU|nr:conserved hypothetical protein [Leishmania mexicana MHOM/GT/2001/U1103]CBZ29605.1 conserved hypothetical protein [Leishmania mexicana MHOM/GT/2001/U1103]
MSTVQLHPHFVAACNYADVSSVVGLLKEPIDSGDFKTNDDAPYLPSAYTSTIHLGDALGELSYPTHPPSPRRRTSNLTTGAKTVHTSFATDASVPSKRSPLSLIEVHVGSEDGKAAPFLIQPSQASPTPSSSRLRLSHGPSLNGVEARRPRVLCIWDVDDTLVASGARGIRQNTVFRDSELVELFRSAGDTARHLLLSQGSIDDVLEKPGGRLWCVRPFLERTTDFTGDGRARAGDTGRSSPAPASSSKGVKKGKSFANFLRCGGVSRTKVQPASRSSLTSHTDASNGGRSASDRLNEHDLRHFASGTVVVRLATVREGSEKVEDSAFLDDPSASLTCKCTFNGQLDDKAEQQGRWLILRPEVWGITLASMNTFFPPSRNTAFVNGKVYRKMDVVWSLAMTSEWDSVFFIDNNLSEVGVVRYGLQMSDMHDLRRQHKVYRFFQADYLLLATSAKLRDLGLRYGRDVTKAPDTAELAPSLEDKQNRSTWGQQAQKAAAAAATSSSSSTVISKGSNAEEASESKLCKFVAVSSSGSAGTTGSQTSGVTSSDAGLYASWKGCSSMRGPGANGVADDVKIVKSKEGDSAPPHPDATSPLMAQRRHRSSNSYPPVEAECLSLRLPSFPPCHRLHEGGNGDLGASVTTANAMMRSPKLSYKDVNLIVVNLHMPSEAYRQVLTTARASSSAQRSMQRANSHLSRYVGQPVFAGDRSCTDEQYKDVLKYFQEAESTLFQLIEEEMRANGFVDVNKASRWVPCTRMVCAPIRIRPTFVPHMLSFYKPFFEEVEERLVETLQRTGGSSASCVLHTEAQRQYYILQRVLPFIDPYLTGDLGRILFDVYTTDGSIPRSLAEQLRKTVARTRERVEPLQKKRRR